MTRVYSILSSIEEFAFDNINHLAVFTLLSTSSNLTNLACDLTGIEGLHNRRKQLSTPGWERDEKMIKTRLRKKYKKVCTRAQNKVKKIDKARQ